MVYHLVLIKMKPHVTARQIAALERAWRVLKKDIPGLRSIDGGPNISIENLDKGFNRAYVVTFANQKARDTYVSHPKHITFANQVALPLVDDVCVMDVKV